VVADAIAAAAERSSTEDLAMGAPEESVTTPETWAAREKTDAKTSKGSGLNGPREETGYTGDLSIGR
jgi:hypothetical protein